jgi:hypothetical protein
MTVPRSAPDPAGRRQVWSDRPIRSAFADTHSGKGSRVAHDNPAARELLGPGLP